MWGKKKLAQNFSVQSTSKKPTTMSVTRGVKMKIKK